MFSWSSVEISLLVVITLTILYKILKFSAKERNFFILPIFFRFYLHNSFIFCNFASEMTYTHVCTSVCCFVAITPVRALCRFRAWQILQRYAIVYSEARALWIKIHEEVCDKPIDNNDDFLQIQKKRQIGNVRRRS